MRGEDKDRIRKVLTANAEKTVWGWKGKPNPHKTDPYTFFDYLKYYFLGVSEHQDEGEEYFHLAWYPLPDDKDSNGREGHIDEIGSSNPQLGKELILFVYNKDPEEAKNTIIHEVLEFVIMGFHRKLGIESGVEELSDDFYKTREKLVESLRAFIENQALTEDKLDPEIAKELEVLGDFVEDE